MDQSADLQAVRSEPCCLAELRCGKKKKEQRIFMRFAPGRNGIASIEDRNVFNASLMIHNRDIRSR